MMFGDADPEDAWDDGDPLPERLAILERVVEAIAAEGDTPRRLTRIADALRLVAKVANELGDLGFRLDQIETALIELGDD